MHHIFNIPEDITLIWHQPHIHENQENEITTATHFRIIADSLIQFYTQPKMYTLNLALFGRTNEMAERKRLLRLSFTSLLVHSCQLPNLQCELNIHKANVSHQKLNWSAVYSLQNLAEARFSQLPAITLSYTKPVSQDTL